MTKVFDRVENHKNYAISSAMNAFIHLGLMGRVKIIVHIDLHAGLSLSHFSNASYKKPNLGINIPTATAGLAYSFSEIELEKRKERSEYTYDRSWNHDVVLSWGLKEKAPIGGKLYNVFSLNYSANKLVSFKSSFGGGCDVFYNGAIKGELNSDDEEIEKSAEIVQFGLSGMYAMQISRFVMFLSPGVYLYSPYKLNGSIYSRIGMRYLIQDKIIINLTIKTHFAVADHVEYGIGYRF